MSTCITTNVKLAMSAGDGYKTGKLYSVLPTDGSGDFTVTGGGNAVSQRSDGTWQINWPANTPRYSWDDGVPSILVESQRQNLITYPRSFGNSYWTKTGAKIEGDPTTAGSDLLSGWDFTSGWSALNSVINNSNTFTSSVINGLIYKNTVGATLNKKYILHITGTVSTGTLTILSGDGITTFGTVSGTFDVYLQANWNTSNNQLTLKNNDIATTNITTLTLQEVSGFSCPFVDSSGVNTLEGFKLVEDTSNGSHVLYTSFSAISGNSYTKSIIAKKGERNYIYIKFSNLNGVFAEDTVWFNLQTGEVETTDSDIIAKIEVLSNGEYTCIATRTALSTNTARIIIGISNNDNINTYTGDGTSGVYICHAQLEQAATASSPIYGAEGSALTRNADLPTVDLPTGVTQVQLTDKDDAITTDSSPADPYTIPTGEWKSIIMT